MLNTVYPGRGSNQDLLRDSKTLYHAAMKDGFYRKAVKVCIINNITTFSLRPEPPPLNKRVQHSLQP